MRRIISPYAVCQTQSMHSWCKKTLLNPDTAATNENMIIVFWWKGYYCIELRFNYIADDHLFLFECYRVVTSYISFELVERKK